MPPFAWGETLILPQVHQAIQEAIQHDVLPALHEATQQMANNVTSDLKSEILQWVFHS